MNNISLGSDTTFCYLLTSWWVFKLLTLFDYEKYHCYVGLMWKFLWSVAPLPIKRLHFELGVVVHAFNPSTWEAEAGRFLSSRPAWSTKWVPVQPGLYRETLTRKTKPNQTKPKQQKQKTNKQTKNSWVIFYCINALHLLHPFLGVVVDGHTISGYCK